MKKNRVLVIGLLPACRQAGVICAVVYLLCGLAGCVPQEITNVKSRGKNIICFGDSISRGHGAKPGEDYPAWLAKMTSIPVINAGINDDTSSEALRRLETDVLSKEPLLVIIEFGGNDFFNKTPLDETVKNIAKMTEIIQSRGAMVVIADISNDILMPEYGTEYARLSKKYKTILITGLLDGIVPSRDLQSDFIHPNSLGYKLIAYRIYRSIIPYLNQNAIFRRARR